MGTSERSSLADHPEGVNADRDRDRLIDLLVSHATEGLGDDERRMMYGLRGRFPDLDATSFEVAAAVFDLVFSGDCEVTALPEPLSRKLRDQAVAWCGPRERRPH